MILSDISEDWYLFEKYFITFTIIYKDMQKYSEIIFLIQLIIAFQPS